MNFFTPYSETKIKSFIKMAVQRIQLLNNKRFESAKQKKRAIGNLLAENKEDKAVIQVEHIIREDYTREGYEILELVLELLHERIRRITTNETCPEDMMETVCCAIWAADNVDIDELQQVKSQLQKKFGREFVRDAPNSDKAKASRLANKLTYKVPSSDLIMSYLTVISESLKVGWTPSTKLLEEMAKRKMDEQNKKDGDDDGEGGGSGMTTAMRSAAWQNEERTAAEQEEYRQFQLNQARGNIAVVEPVVCYKALDGHTAGVGAVSTTATVVAASEIPRAAPAVGPPPAAFPGGPSAPPASNPAVDENMAGLLERLAALQAPHPRSP